MDIDLDQLRELMQALKDFELDELEIEKGEERIILRRSSGATAVMPIAQQALALGSVPPPAASAVTVPPPAAAEASDDATYITSPFVGTFYHAPNPTSPAFVKVGASFESGQVLCIVEAMKLMNEIEAEFDGTVLEVLVENGKPVEYGDRLFKVSKA